jgi:hypothetical protein
MTQAFNLSQLANNINTSGQLNAAAGLYNQVAVANGGTGLATVATGNILVGAGTAAMTSVPAATTGNVLTANGTAWVSQSASGGTPIVRIYSAPTAWTKPSTLKAVKVTLVAGGASGGGSYSGAPPTNGGSGGNGGVLFGYAQAPAIPGPVTATVGVGGVGVGANTDGNGGGTSSFGAVFSTTGGSAGIRGVAGTPGASGANGGTTAITSAPTTASIQIGLGSVQQWGIKGSSGTAGTGYGAGGGGGTGGGGGAAGTGGFIIVEEFY